MKYAPEKSWWFLILCLNLFKHGQASFIINKWTLDPVKRLDADVGHKFLVEEEIFPDVILPWCSSLGFSGVSYLQESLGTVAGAGGEG